MTHQYKKASIAKAQNIARTAMDDLLQFIKPGVTEADIATESRRLMDALGSQSYWYHDVAGFVLVGERTGLSTSGRHYQPSNIIVKDGDLITIDLSPVVDGAWGDYARSVFVVKGQASYAPEVGSVHADAILTIDSIHDALMNMATPDKTTHQVWEKITSFVTEAGYQNADFRGNLGHSVEETLDARRYLEKDGVITLSDLGPFTFEPHIMPLAGGHGYKREDIYYFDGNKLVRV